MYWGKKPKQNFNHVITAFREEAGNRDQGKEGMENDHFPCEANKENLVQPLVCFNNGCEISNTDAADAQRNAINNGASSDDGSHRLMEPKKVPKQMKERGNETGSSLLNDETFHGKTLRTLLPRW